VAAGLPLVQPEPKIFGLRYSLGPILIGPAHVLPEHIVAALAFGTLTVMADWDNEGNEVTIERVSGDWWVNREDRYGGHELECKGSTLPAAVLAAAKRVWCE
jgi:hypothetical protein